MSERFAARFETRPEWMQGMLVLPDLVVVDVRCWVSSNRGRFSISSQTTAGLDAELVQLSVGPDLPWKTPEHAAGLAREQMDRLLSGFVDPFPPKPS